MDKLLTIVIAAYNKEDLLPRCLESLIVEPELMKIVQVLVINDGSKDNTLGVAKEYEQKYPDYIFAIDKANGNYGSVMNKGLELAQGKYFRTLDGDDWYDTKSYREFLIQLSKTDADMIINERYTYYEKTKQIEHTKFTQDIVVNKDLTVSTSIWKENLNYLNIQHIIFKTELIRKSGLKWLEGIFYTDTMYDYWPLRLVHTVRFMSLPVYIYLIGIDEQSMNPNNIRKNYSHFVKVANALINDFANHYDVKSPMYPIQEHFVKQICSFVYLIAVNGDEHFPDILSIHKKLEVLPKVKESIVHSFRWHSIYYLKYLDKGKLPLLFRFIRSILN